VSTEEGLVPIEDIKEGDLVWSQNPETGEIKLRKVEQLFINKSDTILRINVAGKIIEATEQHVFYIDNVGWIPANMIEEGYTVVLQSGEKAIVEDINKVVYEEPIIVYNFEVEGFHTYFVSDINVLVHNRCNQTFIDKQKKGTPNNNKAQNKQFNDVVKKLKLNKKQRRQLHDEISHQGYSYQEILEEAKNMFGK